MKNFLLNVLKALGLRTILIDLGLTALNQVIDKIPYWPIRNYATYLAREMSYVVDRLTDEDPNDKAQLQTLWNIEKANFTSNTIETTRAIAKIEIKDPKVFYVVDNMLKDLNYVLTVGTLPPQLVEYSNALDWSKIKLDDKQDPIL